MCARPLPPPSTPAGSRGSFLMQKSSGSSLDPGGALDLAPTLEHRWDTEALGGQDHSCGNMTCCTETKHSPSPLRDRDGANPGCPGSLGRPQEDEDFLRNCPPPTAWPARLLGRLPADGSRT